MNYDDCPTRRIADEDRQDQPEVDMMVPSTKLRLLFALMVAGLAINYFLVKGLIWCFRKTVDFFF